MGLRRFFITGLVVFIPLVATIYILWLSFNFLDGLLRPFVKLIVGREIPGLGILVTLLLILIVGAFTTIAVGRKAVEIFEKYLLKIPVVKWIYSSIKQVSEVLLMQKTTGFKTVVLVQFPREGSYAIGLTSGATVPEIQDKTKEHLINVFIPTTPNPTSGFFIMVPEKDVIQLDLTVEEAFRLILSGGFTQLPPKETKP